MKSILFLFSLCVHGHQRKLLTKRKRVAEGYPDGATGHFSRPGRGRCSYFFVRHANFETDFNRVKINIKKK